MPRIELSDVELAQKESPLLNLDARKYVVLPEFGFTNPLLSKSRVLQQTGVVRLAAGPWRTDDAATTIRIIDSLRENGPKLVEMTPAAELNLRQQQAGLKVIPVVLYETMRRKATIGKNAPPPPGNGVKVKVVDARSKIGVQGARIVAFTSYRTRAGAEAVTDDSGTGTLALKPSTKVERLYVFPPARYWGYYATSLVLDKGESFAIEAIDVHQESLLLSDFRRSLPRDAGRGVMVGVIDTGVEKEHPNLTNVVGGANTVTEETTDNGDTDPEWGPANIDGDHGTHVAGIIGMKPSADINLTGVAPGVNIRSYRVFPNTGGGATNYDIMKAIDRAVRDGCHIVNLSLGSSDPDEGVRAAIGSAFEQGTLVVAAAGNDGRRPVSYPAAWPAAIAVSAMGIRGSFPATSNEQADVAKPYGNPRREGFIAAFSNYGPQITVGGPGVGVVSTLPGKTFGTMSGTSMATPAVAGFAAFLLSANPDILNKNGDERPRLLR